MSEILEGNDSILTRVSLVGLALQYGQCGPLGEISRWQRRRRKNNLTFTIVAALVLRVVSRLRALSGEVTRLVANAALHLDSSLFDRFDLDSAAICRGWSEWCLATNENAKCGDNLNFISTTSLGTHDSTILVYDTQLHIDLDIFLTKSLRNLPENFPYRP